jgi:hypothetical protein
MKPNSADYIDISIIGDKELEKLFDELVPAVQNRIVMNGMKQAGKIIQDEAKSNFKAIRKNKSKTGYKSINKSFVMEPMQSQFGLKVGVRNFKLHWLEWGTAERSYKKGVKRSIWKKTLDKSGGHNTGEIIGESFFYNAVKSKGDEANNMVGLFIVDSMNKTIEKYATH